MKGTIKRMKLQVGENRKIDKGLPRTYPEQKPNSKKEKKQ